MADQVRGPPYDLLMAVALGMVMAGPSLIGGVGGTMMDLLGPAGLLLLPLPLVLLLLARLLSTDQGAGIFNNITGRSYDSTATVSLLLMLLLLLLFYKRIFSGSGEDDDE